MKRDAEIGFFTKPSMKKGRDTVIPAFLNWLLLVPLVSGGELPAFGCESTPRKMHAHPRSQSQLNVIRPRQRIRAGIRP
jgi:hypothetical protein